MLLEEKQTQTYIEQLHQNLDADIFVFNQKMDYGSVDCFIRMVKDFPNPRENVALILTTTGGDGDAAFRMARFLQEKYKKFILFQKC